MVVGWGLFSFDEKQIKLNEIKIIKVTNDRQNFNRNSREYYL